MKAYEFLADGFEPIEAVSPVDILKRGGVDVVLVSITGSLYVSSNIGVVVKADVLFEDADLSDADVLMTPGGLPGATNLNAHKGVVEAFRKQYGQGKLVASICASPMVLGTAGIAKGKTVTCYPGFESYLEGAHITGGLVEQDGNVITGNSPGAAMPYGFHLLSVLMGDDVSKEVQQSMHFDQLMER